MTPETTKTKIKDYLAIIIGSLAILGAIANYGAMKANNAVLQYKVESNKKILDDYNVPVMNERVVKMSEDVKEIKDLLKEVAKELRN